MPESLLKIVEKNEIPLFFIKFEKPTKGTASGRNLGSLLKKGWSISKLAFIVKRQNRRQNDKGIFAA